MFVAITCPDCRHSGHIPDDMLPRSLKCSRCGGRARFERGAALRGPIVSKQKQLEARRLSFYEQARLRDDVLAAADIAKATADIISQRSRARSDSGIAGGPAQSRLERTLRQPSP